MRTIVVPVDFSPISENAAYYAADLALAIQADVLLLHVVTLPVVVVAEAPVSAEMYDTLIDDAKNEMEKLRKTLFDYSNDKIYISSKVATGNITSEISSLSIETNPIAVVMGIQGAGATERFLFGSNTLKAIRGLNHPVIIVPEHVRFNGIKKIALACDMRDVSETIPVHSIEKILNLFNCHIHLLHVEKSADKLSSSVLPGTRSLQNIFAKYCPEIHIVTNNDVESGIADVVSLQGIDLLLIVPKKHEFPNNIFHKSTSKALASHIRIPMMILHEE